MSASKPSGKKNKATFASIAIAALIGGYTMLRPTLNEATGWNLPALPSQNSQVASDNSKPSGPIVDTSKKLSPAASLETVNQRGSDSPKTEPTARKPGPLASKFSTKSKSTSPVNQSATTTQKNSTTNSGSSTKPAPATADSSLKYGLLREISPDRYMSPEGLLYTPGSAEGHRLKHVERHTADQPSRPGKHGVFDGGMEGALKTIEKAYEKAKVGSRTTKQTDRDRTIYTVDMGKRVGYIGGRDGNRQRKPMARRVRLVVEGNRVITAYPL